MNEREQANHFENEVSKVIERFSYEYNLSYAAAIGVLEVVKHRLMEEMVEFEEDE